MEEWKKVRLGDCIKEINERTTENNQYEVLTSSKSGIYSQEEYFDKQVASKDNTGYKIIKKGQFTYRSMSDNGTFTINRLENKEIGIVSPAYPVFNATSINAEYLKYFFQSDDFRKAIYNLSQGSTRTALKYKDLSDIEIFLPSKEEQEQIVKILKNIDIILSDIEDSIIESNKYKEYILKKLLHDGMKNEGNIDSKIGKIPIKWEIKKLGECALNIKYGLNAASTEYSEEKPKYLRITDIDEYGKYSKEKIVSPNTNEYKDFIVKEGDILFARTGATVGKTYLYNNKDGELVYAGFLICFSLNKNIVNPKFVKYLVNTKRYWNWVNIMSSRSGQPGINSKEFSEYLIPVPSLEEQDKMVNIIEKFEFKNEILENKQIYYKNLKKGLMQKLLTGKVRVKI